MVVFKFNLFLNIIRHFDYFKSQTIDSYIKVLAEIPDVDRDFKNACFPKLYPGYTFPGKNTSFIRGEA